jgi:predicted metalloprotease
MKISLPGRRSENLQDRRGAPASGGGGLPLGGLSAGGGIIGLVLTLALVFFSRGGLGGGGGFGVDDPFNQFPQAPAVQPGGGIPAEADPDADLVDFVSFVLDDTQAFWVDQFAGGGGEYRPAQLVLFTQSTDSGCGFATSQVGPFYCPADETVYIDLDFFRELSTRFGAPGDFAQAYVLAHEIGHHVQHVTGISDEVNRLRQRNPDDANELSVRLELQADCLAGVWAQSTYERGLLEEGDLEEGLAAATAVGDDRIQQQAGVRVNPETWTHGSSEQRTEWFTRGFDTGDANECDTFA